ncbi:MAG TPA: hypothetical protein PK583_02805 [Gammaproteobacteria bacterium]|nr:hypothetical protein [Gammaproteobacteria bacterium]HQY22945.1 hypothetical protein [Gammaproteobacteria bacterium]HQZ87187.1 hypothetical protein [Gammaproteobacteria bacterium]HRA43122.1 hypothetical protein [Gammaproteobacteria bacterium]
MKYWLLEKLKNLPFIKKKAKAAPIQSTDEEDLAEQELWWGTFLIEEEQSRFFKIGQLVTCVDRFNHKWHITTYHEGEQPFKTFAAQTSNTINLKPMLPDRALLSLLDRPCYIPLGETLRVYISVPLWIQISAGNPITILDEFATETLADTWFGKSTRAGELCYNNPIHGSPRLEDLPQDSTHAIIPVSIENRTKGTNLLHELKIPLDNLALYSDKKNRLWTEDVHLCQEDTNSLETLTVKNAPLPLSDLQLVSPARVMIKPGLKNFFGSFMWE